MGVELQGRRERHTRGSPHPPATGSKPVLLLSRESRSACPSPVDTSRREESGWMSVLAVLWLGLLQPGCGGATRRRPVTNGGPSAHLSQTVHGPG